jgi:hypothetical protein
VIAAKVAWRGVAPAFRAYARNVIENAKAS